MVGTQSANIASAFAFHVNEPFAVGLPHTNNTCVKHAIDTILFLLFPATQDHEGKYPETHPPLPIIDSCRELEGSAGRGILSCAQAVIMTRAATHAKIMDCGATFAPQSNLYFFRILDCIIISIAIH